MNLSAPFIARPVATTLLTIGIALAGLVAFLKLPVSPLPKVDYPTIQVSASLPGASPETVATSLTTPLERVLGSIAGSAWSRSICMRRSVRPLDGVTVTASGAPVCTTWIAMPSSVATVRSPAGRMRARRKGRSLGDT